MSGPVLILCEHDGGVISPELEQILTAGGRLAQRLDAPLEAVLVGAEEAVVGALAGRGVQVVHHVAHPELLDYGPAAWGAGLAAVIEGCGPSAVLALGTDRGNEVMAHTASRMDLPLATNCVEVTPAIPWTLTRVQWGGSLLEDCTLDTDLPLLTMARHVTEPDPPNSGPAPLLRTWSVELSAAELAGQVQARESVEQGVTLATAAVVVSGGRGVGSAEGFTVLEDLAGLLSGRVGCSRAVTNNGWRSHTDQVGQTGTRIAPELYIACGISGAVQHWVGAMASKRILAVNTDPAANMVVKADYAVIGDLHEIVPAIAAEIRRRRSG